MYHYISIYKFTNYIALVEAIGKEEEECYSFFKLTKKTITLTLTRQCHINIQETDANSLNPATESLF